MDQLVARRIYAVLRDSLSPFDSYLFEKLILEELSPEDLASVTGLSVGEIEARRERLLAEIRRVAGEVGE